MRALQKFLLVVFSLCLPAFDLIADGSVHFLENKGQWESSLLFRAEFPGGYLFLKKNSMVYVLYDASSLHQTHIKNPSSSARSSIPATIASHGVEVFFEGGNASTISTNLPLSPKTHYFSGLESANWVSNVTSFQEIVYKDLYPGIDFRIFSYQTTLKYEFIVKPQADPSLIRLQYKGADQISIDEHDQVTIKTSIRSFKEAKPFSYQKINRENREVPSSFLLNGSHLTFRLPEGYNSSLPLVIDPELIFSTYSGSLPDNWGHTATYDDEGNLYSGGTVFGTRFPVTTGAYQVQFSGNADVALMKFSPDGSKLLYATYLGGQETDIPTSLIVNKKGELLICGITSSANFPTTSGAFQKTFAGGDSIQPVSGLPLRKGSDIFVAKLSADGARLLASTFIGGSGNDGVSSTSLTRIRNYGDNFRSEIIVDPNDNIVVATSTNSINFPLKDAFKTTLSGSQDGVVFQLSPALDNLQWSSYLGGNKYDAAFSIKTSNEGDFYITGITQSTNLPVHAEAIQKELKGGEDAFVARIRNRQLQQITYLGTDAADGGYLLDRDPQGNVHILGLTYGIYPVSSGVYSNERSGQFIHAVDPTLSKTIFSTVIGTRQSAPDISPTAFLINDCGNIYLSGWGGNANSFSNNNPLSTTRGLPVTEDALQKTTNGSNLYIAILEAGAKSLLYATYFGSVSTPNPAADPGDHVDGGTSRFSKQGVIYHALCACSGTRFPTTPNAWSRTNGSDNCNNAAFKIDIDVLKADFDIYQGTTKGVTDGCTPLTLAFTNTSIGGIEYTWQINGAGFSRKKDESYTFTQPGEYTVTLRAFNKLTCQKEDVVSRQIKVRGFDALAKGDTVVCHNQPVQLYAAGGSSYQWTPAIGLNSTTTATPIATVSETTTFQVEIKDNTGCSAKKSVIVTINDSKPDFSVMPDKVACSNQPLQLTAEGSAESFVWKPEPSLSSLTGASVTALPTKTTTYWVTGYYADGCSPTRSVTITVDQSYLPDFEIRRSNEACNEPIYYELVNMTSGGEHYEWNTGNGSMTSEHSIKNLVYDTPGIYTVWLTAYNKSGCSLSTSKELRAEPSLILANVITPNGDRKNDTFVVPVEHSQLEIYNRWGKEIFKSTDYQNDWGKDIPNGTYYYLVETPGGSRCKGWIQVLD